jgi:hypothetical protein
VTTRVHDVTGEELPLNGIRIYETPNGWIYEVWFMGRASVIGCCTTFAAATREAALA